jgi:hypothetical protein
MTWRRDGLVVDERFAGEREIERLDLGRHEFAYPSELRREVGRDFEIRHGMPLD